MTQYQVAVTNLKKILKTKGISYRELSEGLGLSESGLKKIMSARDGSFERLYQMCRYAGIHLKEILAGPASQELEFSAVIQKEFSKDLALFSLFWHLVYERKTLEAAPARFKLTRAQIFKLARKLDQLKLLRLLPGDRVRVPAVRPVKWVQEGDFIRYLYQSWSARMVQKLASGGANSQEQVFALRYLKIKKQTYHEYVLALQGLEEEFLRRSIQEMQSQEADLLDVRLLLGMDQQSFLEQTI